MTKRIGRWVVVLAVPVGVTLGTLISGAFFAGGSSAQAQVAKQSGAQREDAPFELAGKKFASQREFVTSGRRCDTAIPTEAQIRGSVQAADAVRQLAGVEASLNPSNTVKIPVAFHVIHKGNEGKVSKGQLKQQLNVLNEAYKSSGFLLEIRDEAADITFTDVAGTPNVAWFTMGHQSAAEREAKQELSKNHDPRRYLNFYTANLGDSLLGWATFPKDLEFNLFLDGVVVLYTSLPAEDGSPNPQGGPYGLGHTGTHELGHWLGLFHTFQGGCVPPGDGVADTPPHQGNVGCPSETTDTCVGGLTDPIHNFMNYTDDACMNEFKDGQVTRMREQTTTFRKELYELPENLQERIQAAARSVAR